MVIYEVNLEISPEVANDYKIWLQKHILQMLEINGFSSYKLFAEKSQIIDSGSNNEDKTCKLVVHYEVDSKESLDEYLANQAKSMRGGIPKEFFGKFKAWRRVLMPEDQS